MPIQPVKIPQNVYIEDRIVGPLTLRQIIIVGIGCGFSYALWASMSKAYGYVGIPLTVLVWIPGGLSVLFAFVRINDITLFRICLLFLERIGKPSIRTFSPRQGITINIRTFSVPAKEATPPASKPSAKIEELSTVLDASLQKEDTEETEGTDPTSLRELRGAGGTEEDSSTSSRLRPPVQRDRIRVSPGPSDPSVDGAQEQRVSLLRDIAPSSP